MADERFPWRVAVVSGAAALAAAAAAADTRDVAKICAGDTIVFDGPDFAVFDANADAMLDEQETRRCESLRTVFDELDVDGDQFLSELEYLTFPAMWRQRRLAFGND
jgi:hypothetical protein